MFFFRCSSLFLKIAKNFVYRYNTAFVFLHITSLLQHYISERSHNRATIDGYSPAMHEIQIRIPENISRFIGNPHMRAGLQGCGKATDRSREAWRTRDHPERWYSPSAPWLPRLVRSGQHWSWPNDNKARGTTTKSKSNRIYGTTYEKQNNKTAKRKSGITTINAVWTYREPRATVPRSITNKKHGTTSVNGVANGYRNHIQYKKIIVIYSCIL